MSKVSILPTSNAYSYVLENAGATLPTRDAVDRRIIEEVKTGKIIYSEKAQLGNGTKFVKRRLPADSYKLGIITHPDQVGGYPVYRGSPYKDSDNDGMPDAWEMKQGLNPDNSADASLDRDRDGYTNIEEFLNSVVEVKHVSPSKGF